MQTMLRLTGIRQSTSVLDIGGTPAIWDYDWLPKLDITILNLPGAVVRASVSRHNFRYIVGNGCDLPDLSDQSFDFVFSNSVIEHVGAAEQRAAFAREVRRLGKSYWVQTPSIWFPIEAHTGMPFWWFYPNWVRQWILSRWRRKLPPWTEMVEGTTVVYKQELRRLFPEARIIVERLMGIPKSYIAVSAAVGPLS